jgi:undecaprenyl-diphosphatase
MKRIIKYIILGIIQGVTEPLPISSSGHIFLLKKLIDIDILNDLNFEIILHTGSLLAIIFLYYKDLKNLIINSIRYVKTKNELYKIDFKYLLLIIIGTLPVSLVGYIFKNIIESLLNDNIFIICFSFILTSIFLFFIRNKKGYKSDYDISYKDALYIGTIQIFALLPGISRSGCTLIASLSRNIKIDNSLKYSFMLFIPIGIGSTILGIKDLINIDNNLIISYIIGFIFSFVISIFTLKWFKKFVKNGNLLYFAIYCLIIGIMSIIIFS